MRTERYGGKHKRAGSRRHLCRPKAGYGVLHGHDELNNHCNQQLQHKIHHQPPLDDRRARVAVAVYKAGRSQKVGEAARGRHALGLVAQAADVAKADDFGGHGDGDEGNAYADCDVVDGPDDDGAGLQQLQHGQRQVQEIALDGRHARAQALLHYQRQGHGEQHGGNCEARGPALYGADEGHHDGEVDEHAVLLQVADAYTQRHEEQAADAEVEPAAVQVKLRHGNALGLRLLQSSHCFSCAEADDGRPRLKLGQRPRCVLALGGRMSVWLAAPLSLGKRRYR